MLNLQIPGHQATKPPRRHGGRREEEEEHRAHYKLVLMRCLPLVRCTPRHSRPTTTDWSSRLSDTSRWSPAVQRRVESVVEDRAISLSKLQYEVIAFLGSVFNAEVIKRIKNLSPTC